MRAPQNGRHLTDDHFTKEDVAEFHRLMGELLSTCRAIGEQYAPEERGPRPRPVSWSSSANPCK